MTNMLWVDNPVGTGFSQGRITARSEEGVAKDFVGFFENFEKLFGINNYKIYMAVCDAICSQLQRSKVMSTSDDC